jgi:hypothetical protein
MGRFWRYLGLKNDPQVANGMVTECLGNESLWILAICEGQVSQHRRDGVQMREE